MCGEFLACGSNENNLIIFDFNEKILKHKL